MGRGGCNCCGDWCTNAKVEPNHGSLQWNFNFGDDAFSVGQINDSVYTCGASFLSNWGYYNGTVRKSPFGSSHVYETVNHAYDSSSGPYSLYMKRLDKKGKLRAAKNVPLSYLYYYPYYWYGWSPYVDNLLRFNSTKDHLHIRGSSNIAFVENKEAAKYVMNSAEIGGEVQTVSNYEVDWDLLPSYMYSSSNNIYGWSGWSGFGPLAYNYGLNNHKNSVFAGDTVVFGSESSYYSYYNASGFSNMVISFNGVDDNRVYFKAIGKLNMTPYTQVSTLNENNGKTAINIQNSFNGDAILNIFPNGGGQIHNYDAFINGNGDVDYSNAQPLARVLPDGSIETYQEDLVDSLANSIWAVMTFNSCILSEGAFELYFSLPRVDFDNNDNIGIVTQVNPETWPGLLQGMSFGMNFSYSTFWDEVDNLGNYTSHGGTSYVNAVMSQVATGFQGTIWEYSVGYYFSPISVTIPMLNNSITDISYYFAYNTAFIQLNQDSIQYFNRDFTSFALNNIGFPITNPNSISRIPLYAEVSLPVNGGQIDTSPLDEYYNSPADFFGIDTVTSLGQTISFNFAGVPGGIAPYVFNKVGYDINLYTVITLMYLLYNIRYQVATSVSIIQPNGSDTTIAKIEGFAVPVAQNPVVTNSSFSIDLDTNYNILGGVLLNQDVSNILRYDMTNYQALTLGFGPYLWTNLPLNSVINNAGIYWSGFYYGYGYAYGHSVDSIERTNGQLFIAVNEQFNKFIQDSNQLAILNNANVNGAIVPIVSTNNEAIFRNKNLIVRDDTGTLASLLGQTYQGQAARMYNTNPMASVYSALYQSSKNLITVNRDGTVANANFIPHLTTMSSDNRGNVIVGGINSSNRVLMSTGNTYLLGSGPIDFSRAITNAGITNPDVIAAINSFSGSDYMYPAECIYLTPDFNDQTIDFRHGGEFVIQMNGTNISIPLQATAGQITAIFNKLGYDVTVVGGPITQCAIMITSLNSAGFSNIIDGFTVNDSLGKYRAGTGFWPIYGDAVQYSYYNSFLRPEQFSADYNDVLWNFSSDQAIPDFYQIYSWWTYGTFAGFYNSTIWYQILLNYALDHGWSIQYVDNGIGWIVTDPRGFQALADEVYQSRLKIAGPLTEQMGFISPYLEFTSDSKDRVSWAKYMTINDLAQRMVYPEFLDLSWVFGAGSNVSSLFHSGFAVKAMNSISTLKSKPAALYQVKGNGQIGWTTPFGYGNREEKVNGITYEESPSFCGKINDMTVNAGGDIYIATNMVNLGESKPTAYTSYSEYYNNEILNRIDVRHATKSRDNPNADASGMAPDGNGDLQFVPVQNRNTAIFDTLASVDSPISPKIRYRTTAEPLKIVRNL